MNILQPEIIRYGGRRYRKNPFKLNANLTREDEIRPYEEETEDMYFENRAQSKYQDEYDDEPCGVSSNNKCLQESKKPVEEVLSSAASDQQKGIEFGADGKYKCVLTVAQTYMGALIGRNGEKKHSLERETSTSIRMPRRGQGDWLSIEAKTKNAVIACRNRVEIMIRNMRLQKPFTHLLTFPLKFDALKEKLNEFRKLVLRSCLDDRGMDDSIFQNEHKLHLTICTVNLLSESEVDTAVQLLEDCRRTFIRDILESKPLTVHIRGLEYMNDDPSDVDVLYAKIEPVGDEGTSRIQQISDKLMTTFVDAGLSKKQFDRVKLHATIMNSLRRDEPGAPANERQSFDARNIFKLYSDFDFGTYTLNELDLSLRFSAAADGYYECISKINL